MAFDYTAYPTSANLVTFMSSAGITLPSAVTSDIQTLKLNAAISLLEHKTGRAFAPTASTTRTFDGSGTGSMEIDEYIDITSILLYTLPSQSTVEMLNYVEVERVPFARTKVQVLQGPANIPYGWYTYFPAGRSNVAITATWGYGSSIPAAVWNAVLCQAAAEIVDGARASLNGALIGLKDLDQDFTWSDKLTSEVAGWRKAFVDTCATFRRPLSAVTRRKTSVLI